MKALFAADICPTEYTVENFKNGDVNALFGDTVSLFKECDFSFVNLECAITDSDGAIKKFGPNLKAPSNTAAIFKALGVSLCGISNNHVFDFGKKGALDTIAALSEEGIPYTGFGENYEDSRKDYIFEKEGERICVIAVCEHEYSYALENRMGSRPFDEFETIEDIRAAKKNADRVIVAYHGGKEMCHYPSPRLIRVCRAMARAGADLIMCQHTHCIGAYEQYMGAHIVYGQGNFNFVNPKNPLPSWHMGFSVMYDTKANTVELVPHVENEASSGIRLANSCERETILGDVEKYSKSLADGTWKDGWHKFCVDNADAYIPRIARLCTSEATERDNAMLSHYLDCEAHNDLLRELFPSWNFTNEV